MRKLLLMLLLCEAASAVTHSLKYILTGSSGIRNLPEFVGVAMVNEVQVGYCDSNIKRAEFRPDWIKKMKVDDPQHVQWHSHECFTSHLSFKDLLENLKQRLNQTGEVNIVQQMVGCEWDDETGEVKGFNQYSYNGEDFITLDLETMTWIAPTPKAVIMKHKWDTEKGRLNFNKMYLTKHIPEWLKMLLEYGKNCLLRTDLPSVSLLQKTPSSQVTCHATGFYPDRSDLFWRKDGEELHEDVDKGEILPNHDGTFQMSVDLKISSIPAEDWKKYDCVFQLSGVKDDIEKKLDKAVIRTNEGNSLSMMIIPIVAAVVVLAVIAVVGFIVYKKKKDKRPPSPVENKEVQEEMLPQA